jgi:hypothetical protein
MSAPQIPIEISPQRVACPGHGEHLRASWPSGFAVFSMLLFKAAVESPKLQEACRIEANLKADEPLPPPVINLVTEHRPLCYFVERTVIANALREMGTLRIARCDLCGVPGFAGPYSVNMMGRIDTVTACVDCACNAGERLHAAHPNGGVWT